MKAGTSSILILSFLLLLQPVSIAYGQEASYRIIDIIELPAELLLSPDSSCQVEFHEQWILNTDRPSINKEVKKFEISCGRQESFRLREFSYEFSFLNAHKETDGKNINSESLTIDEEVRSLQQHIISLMKPGRAFNDMYCPQEQLLSVYFHEEWILNADTREFKKRVLGLTPVIWQLRQNSEGEPINDAETGLPVYFKTRLERIDLRNP